MKILKVEKTELFDVETEGGERNEFTRYGSESWYVTMGDSQEPYYDCEELEKAFQIHLKDNHGYNDKFTDLTPSNAYYDTEVVVDGKKYRIGFDSVFLSLENNTVTGWTLWNKHSDPQQIGSEFNSKEFKIYMKGILIFEKKHLPNQQEQNNHDNQRSSIKI